MVARYAPEHEPGMDLLHTPWEEEKVKDAQPRPGPESAEAGLLIKASQGDENARRSVCQYLSSSNIDLVRLMQGALHGLSNTPAAASVWRWLLEHAAEETEPADRTPGADRHQRCFHAIAEAFILDDTPQEAEVKTNMLKQVVKEVDVQLSTSSRGRAALNDDYRPPRSWRATAAYLLALRGYHEVIPLLEDLIDRSVLPWQLRAVHALHALHDPRCGPALLKALASADAVLHRAASRALIDLGPLARQTWIEALNHPSTHVRWHAARGLGQIGDPAGLDILAEGLADEKHAVRWATANVLASLDSLAIPSILSVLTRIPLREPFRQAAYHALHAMPSTHTQAYLAPLLRALRGVNFSIEAPAIAQRLLQDWRRDLSPDKK